MIEEIPYPYPSIQQYIQESEYYRVKYEEEIYENQNDVKNSFDDYKYVDIEDPVVKSNLGLYDVAFNSDPGIVLDFSKKLNISYTLAEALLIIFFQELKNQLLKGKFISINKFGKFWTVAPGIDEKNNFHFPTGRHIAPRYKAGRKIRRKVRNNIL